jgi:hypothetical protein
MKQMLKIECMEEDVRYGGRRKVGMEKDGLYGRIWKVQRKMDDMEEDGRYGGRW